MESPNKRQKLSPEANDDFVAFGDDDEGGQFGYGGQESLQQEEAPKNAPRGPRRQYLNDPRFERRNAQDRPKSKHPLPGHETWVVVRTRFGRRFVHNTKTKESLWHAPDDIWPAVKEFDAWERDQKEKAANAKWAEEELKKLRATSQAEKVNEKADAEQGRDGRRRSESLQREDEEAMMAELAAEAEHAEEQDVKAVVKTFEPVAGDVGYDSEGSYEYVEVTDDEGEDDEEQAEDVSQPDANGDTEAQLQPEDGPVEFGEDDIAWQLQAMGQDYHLDPGDYDAGDDHAYEDGAEGLPISDQDAADLFRDLLDDHHISPFTPWEKLISDTTASSILHDDRYTVLPTLRARKEIWDAWSRARAAQIQAARATTEQLDPRIPYLALLAEKATPKLYWPEFKRKYKKEPALTDRKLGEKEREKLYREHVSRLRLPQSTLKADLLNLLKSVPLRHLNRDTPRDALPQQLLSHLHFVSLPVEVRDEVVGKYIMSLPRVAEGGG
ncbi:FF domain [Teratosphaeria destructans]|uniref:FF domain n=1 Tax=Teratosphaeria destructans TaxID=418781 RepID=A0A9W7W4D2_9PEZI|nr:FF domain [Teratosphaeria destructans]